MPTYTDIRVSASIETVTEYGLHHWLKIDFGGNLNAGETPMDAFLAAKKEVDAMESLTRSTPSISVEKKDTIAVINGIRSCVAIDGEDGLKSFELRARNTPGAMELYNKQFDTILNGKPTDKQIAKSHFKKDGKVKLP